MKKVTKKIKLASANFMFINKEDKSTEQKNVWYPAGIGVDELTRHLKGDGYIGVRLTDEYTQEAEICMSILDFFFNAEVKGIEEV